MRFVRAYLHAKQEAFLDGFVHAFEFLGGVPTEGLLDNLKTAVIKILQGRDRLEQEAFIGLQACLKLNSVILLVETNRYSVPCSYAGQAVWEKFLSIV
jgi:hypothetical protein